jgi:methionyl aminopeptidase
VIVCKSEREIVFMKDAGRIVAQAHREIKIAIRPGITTLELNKIAEEVILSNGARPAFKGYQGFPASICTSVNEEVVHGIPSLRKLENGDIISIDIGAEKNGYYADSAITLPVGDVSDEALELIRITKEALFYGISKAVSGNRLTDISYSIQSFVEGKGYSVVRDYVGHGIGTKMHEEPQVPNFGGQPGRGPRLRPGMTLAIEPMVNAGTYEVMTLGDDWTVVTKDRKLSAHFEHSIAITDKESEILTII